MNKYRIFIASAFLIATSAATLSGTASAMPVVAIDQCVGLLGSPVAQTPNQDPLVEQAIDVLKSKDWLHNIDRTKPTTPETTISKRKNLDGVLILGGAESIPM